MWNEYFVNQITTTLLSGSVLKIEKLQLDCWISILTIQDANSIVIWKEHPKVHVNNLITSQLLTSTNRSIISGAVWKIVGITVL